MRLFRRRRQVADDNGMLPVAKKEPRTSRRIGDGFFQRMRDLVRPIRVAPSPVIKQEPSRRSRTSKDILFGDDTIYSPFSLKELPHSTSRNRTSKRFPLQDTEELLRTHNLLKILDSSPKTLNHNTITKYLNRQNYDGYGITEIKLYREDLSNILNTYKEDIKRLLKSTLQQSNNIETIEIDVPYLIPVILELEPRKLSTIQGLILRSDYESPKPITDEVIFYLLSMIGKMENLEELEFSQFEIDVGNFKGGLSFNDLFRSIVRLNKLGKITFNGNVFTDNVKEGEYDDFNNKYFSKDGVRRTDLDRIRILVEWIINNREPRILGFNAYKVYIHSNFWKTHVQQQNRYNRMKTPDDSKEKQAYLKEQRSNLPKISDVRFEDFLKDDEAVKGWLKWLIINEGDIRDIGDIVERLRIVIGYFKNNIDSIVKFFEENQELQSIIISEFNRKVASTYKPRPNDEYNRIITEIIGDKLVRSRGGRKAPKKTPKQPTKPPKAPKKTPKQSTKPPKAPKKMPKQSTKPPKALTKTPKQPKKPTTVARKAPTKPTTVARKVNKKK